MRATEITPIDDVRSTAAYRLRVAQNLLAQLLEQCRASAAAPNDVLTIPTSLRTGRQHQAYASDASVFLQRCELHRSYAPIVNWLHDHAVCGKHQHSRDTSPVRSSMPHNRSIS